MSNIKEVAAPPKITLGPRGGIIGMALLVYEILFCLILSTNVAFVFFDYTYLMRIPYLNMTFRDVYSRVAQIEGFDFLYDTEQATVSLPADPLTGKKESAKTRVLFYDQVKGIQPHRTTFGYLQNFDRFKARLKTEGATFSPDTKKLRDWLVKEMEGMINKRPPLSDFSLAEKDGALERAKNAMRKHFARPGENHLLKSAKGSFRRFFTEENLSLERRAAELAFFDREIRPLLEENYFRWLGDDGEPKDYYSKEIDWRFVLLVFWPDFLIRWMHAIYTRRYRKWFLFPVRNWPDLFLLFTLPALPMLRLFRIMALYTRLQSNGWLPADGVVPSLVHDNAAIIAEEISGFVLLSFISQSQNQLRTRKFAELKEMIDPPTYEKIQDLIDSNIDIISGKMVPTIQPQVVDMVKFSIDRAMGPVMESPLGNPLKMALSPVYQSIQDGLEAALSSEEGKQRLKRILHTSIEAIVQEVTAPENIAVLQDQVADLLEEVKREVQEELSKK